MVTKEDLKKYASKLMFNMKEEEYDVLLKEFDIILKQMDLINDIDGLSNVNPMYYPFELLVDDSYLREDTPINEINFRDMKINIKECENNMVKVPKVVE